jgi:PII-like signaling protein
MSISDLYMSVDQKRNISHFANIVKIAKADGVITSEEKDILKVIAKKYMIGEAEVNEIFKNPENYPIRAHLSCKERIERLYDLVKMMNADHKVALREVSVLRIIVIGLAFPLKNVENIIECAVSIDIDKCRLDNFYKEIMKVNKI